MSSASSDRRRVAEAASARDVDASRSGQPDSEEGTSPILTPDSDDEDRNGYQAAAGEDGIELRALQTRRPGPGEGGRPGDQDDDVDDDNLDDDEWDGHEDRRPRRRRASASTVASFQLYTPDEERAVVRKFDRRLVLFVALLYMLSFLDRSNIGNAKIAGMDEDLQSRPPRDDYYEWALTAFYLAYIAFEWMSLLWRLIPAHIYVAAIVLSWGLTASLQAVAPSYPVLIFLRVLLGIGEAGFTGIPFYLSFFFKRDELAFRTAVFISAAPLATSFASSLAWLILKLGRASPIAPWRLLFLLEGFPAVLVSVIAWRVIPDSPQTAPYLTAREKKVARLRLRHEQPRDQRGPRRRRRRGETPNGAPGPRAARSAALAVLLDPAAWLTAAMFFLANMAYASLPVFLPTILTEMGHSALSAQALTAPPFLVAFALVLATARLSDRARARAPLLVANALASAAGYGLLALSRGPLALPPGSAWRYAAVYPAAAGFFGVVVLLIAWTVNNQPGPARQGGAFALFQLVGQCGPLLGTRLYPARDAPYYERGMAVMAGAMVGVAVLTVVLRVWLGRQNRRMDRDEAAGDGVGERARGEEETSLVGPSRRRGAGVERFRYML